MKRVLFAWELGNGLGHLGRFQPLQAALVKRGATCVMALRELSKLPAVFGSNAIDAWQAPIPLPVNTEARRHVGYADSLCRIGYGDAGALATLVKAWLRIFAAERPDVLIADYAPTALLAARIAGVPIALYGCTFARPPSIDPLPAYRWWQPGDDVESIRSIEQRVVTACNSVLEQHAARPINTLAALFEARFDWLTTVRELDHYGTRDSGEFIGPVSGLKMGDAPRWPEGSGPKVFMYLREDGELAHQVRRLSAETGCARIDLFAEWGSSG